MCSSYTESLDANQYLERSTGWECFQIPMPVFDKIESEEWSGSVAGGGMYVRITHQWYVGSDMCVCAVIGVGEAFEWGVEAIAYPLISKIWRAPEAFS